MDCRIWTVEYVFKLERKTREDINRSLARKNFYKIAFVQLYMLETWRLAITENGVRGCHVHVTHSVNAMS